VARSGPRRRQESLIFTPVLGGVIVELLLLVWPARIGCGGMAFIRPVRTRGGAKAAGYCRAAREAKVP